MCFIFARMCLLASFAFSVFWFRGKHAAGSTNRGENKVHMRYRNDKNKTEISRAAKVKSAQHSISDPNHGIGKGARMIAVMVTP